jgi:hypothetical protein
MRFLSVLAADLRFALRMARQNPAFSSIAIVCLALGIGGNSVTGNETAKLREFRSQSPNCGTFNGCF